MKLALPFKLKSPKRKSKTRIAATIFSAILIAAIVYGISLFFNKPTQAEAWFDDSYLYRQPISFTHNADIAAERAVTFSLDTAELIAAGYMQADCDDTRFTDLNGQLLKYQLTGACNNAATTYEVVYLSIVNGSNSSYVYYGKSTAATASQNVSAVTALTPSGGDPAITTVTAQEKSPGPIAAWNFDDGTGTNAQDSTANNNDGTLTSGPVWKNESDCISGKCLYFDGSNDYVNMSDPSNGALDPGTNSFTISFWAKGMKLAGPTTQFVYQKGALNDSTSGYSFFFNTSGNITLRLGDGTTMLAYTYNGISNYVSDAKWAHYSAVINRTDNTAKIYINTTLVGSQDISVYSGASFSGTSAFSIGRNAQSFLGFIDEVRIYPYARTAAQIKTDYAARGSSQGASAQFGAGGASSGEKLSNGLVGYWKLDESSGNATDSSGNTNTLTDINTVAFTGGKFGNSGDFELDNSEYQYIDDNAILSITGNLTLSAWIKPESVSAGTYNIASKWDGSNESYRLIQNADEIRLELDSNGNYVETSASNLAAATWYHIVGIYNASSSTAQIYINGNLATTTTTGTIPSSIGDDAGRFHLGAEDSTTTAANFYDGLIDQVRIYNRALTPAEVRALYAFAPGPVAHYKLDENTGTSANDTSGNSITATLTNGPTWTPGKFGSGVNFDGTNDVVSLATASDANVDFNGTEAFSAGAWVYVTTMPGSSNQDAIISKYDETSTLRGYRLVVENDDADATGNFQVEIYDESADQTLIATGANDTVSANTWYYVYFTFNGGIAGAAADLNLYTNGTLTGSNSANASFLGLEDIAVDFTIGDYDTTDVVANNTAFTGIIDDVRIYNYARTQGQVVEDMNAGSAPGGSQALYWKFDEGYGTSAYSSGVVTNTGTLAGTTLPAWKNDGKFGKALDFTAATDTTGSRISTSVINLSSTTGEQLTASVWVKPDSTQTNVLGAIIRNGSGVDMNYGIYLTSLSAGNFHIYVQYYDGTTFRTLSTTNRIVPVSVWSNITVVITQGQNAKIYLNGKYIQTIAWSGANSVQATSGFYVGSVNSANGHSFDGYIDEVKIYNAGLTDEQVALDYNQGKAATFGALSTTSTGLVADNSSAREYCLPGDTSTCNAPVAEWKLDEATGTSANDTSGNANTGTLTNGPTWVNGKIGMAVKFDGSDDYITVGNSTFNISNQMSLSVWLKSGIQSTYTGIISKDDGTNRSWKLSSDLTGRYLDFYVFNTSSYTSVSTSQVHDDNKWHHVTATYDASTIRIYVDGLLENSTALSDGVRSSTATVLLGDDGCCGAGRKFNGSIDQVRIYNYARTPAQIAWEYNRGAPVAWYKLDECQGTTAYNSALNGNGQAAGNNGTITIGVTGTNDGAGTCTGDSSEAWNNGESGKINGSLSFDGTDDYVSVADDAALRNTYATLSTWIKTSTNPGIFGGIISHFSASDGYNILQMSDGTIRAYRRISGDWAYAESTSSKSDGNWHHVVAIYDNTNTYLYIDGKLDATNTNANATVFANSSYQIGLYSPNTYFFNGQIDDVRIYNYALTLAQIRDVYNNGAVSFK